jgi:predicted transcriptional regulator
VVTKNWSDDELINLIWDYRIANGACSLGDLRKATGMSKSQLGVRVNALVAEGRVKANSAHGSIRSADERLMREMPDGRLLEMTKNHRRRAS